MKLLDLRMYLKRLGNPKLPANPADLTYDQVQLVEQLLTKDLETPEAQVRPAKTFLKGVIYDLAKLKKAITVQPPKRGSSDVRTQNFDRAALRDYANNTAEWVKFLRSPASELNKQKLSRQAHYWIGANDETRAAILRSSKALTIKGEPA